MAKIEGDNENEEEARKNILEAGNRRTLMTDSIDPGRLKSASRGSRPGNPKAKPLSPKWKTRRIFSGEPAAQKVAWPSLYTVNPVGYKFLAMPRVPFPYLGPYSVVVFASEA